MLKFKLRSIFPGCLFLFFASMVIAETDGFTIRGIVNYNNSGAIIVKLLDQSEFERDISGKDPQSPFILKINADPSKGEIKSVQFLFTNVPAGAYAISVFQDVNGNGKLDMGLFGPVEPWECQG